MAWWAPGIKPRFTHHNCLDDLSVCNKEWKAETGQKSLTVRVLSSTLQSALKQIFLPSQEFSTINPEPQPISEALPSSINGIKAGFMYFLTPPFLKFEVSL